MDIADLAARIEAARHELLDLSLSNPLINYRLRAKGVETTGADPERVFERLVRKGQTIYFLPRPDEDESDAQGLLGIDAPEPSDQDKSLTSTQKSTDNRLQTSYSTNELDSRLLKTYYASHTLLEDTGVNSLFVALGMVQWYESDASEQELRAPIVLIPVKLDRASVRHGFGIEYTGEDVGTNVPLMEKFRIDFRTDLPHVNDDFEDDQEIDLPVYFEKAQRSIEGMVRWSVDTSSVVLGFFSYNKFLMWKDLDTKAWTMGSGFFESHILHSVLGDGFKDPGPAIDEDAHLDQFLRPEDVHDVVDADSSQVRAILDVNNGRNLVVQGPPGTGKSQTITNIIADAIGQGKKVLFVSEKMAALEVVKRRLDELKLGDACLELHSHKTAKKTVLDEIKRTLELGRPNAEGIEDDFTFLERSRNSLNQYSDAVNNPVGNTGITPFRANGELLRLRNYRGESAGQFPQLQIDGLGAWSNIEYSEKRDIVERLQNGLRQTGPLKDHVFYGSQIRDVMADDLERLAGTIHAAQESLAVLDAALMALADVMRLKAPSNNDQTEMLLFTAKQVAAAPDISGIDLEAPEWGDRRYDIECLKDMGQKCAKLKGKYGSVLTPDAWQNAHAVEIRYSLSTAGRRVFRILFPEYRRATKQLSQLCRGETPRNVEDQIELIDGILEWQKLIHEIKELSPVPTATLGSRWNEEDSDWDAILPIIEWMLALLDQVGDGKVSKDIVSSLGSGIDTSVVPQLLEQASVALGIYQDSLREILDPLKMDTEKRFGYPDGFARLTYREQLETLTAWASSVHEIHDIARVNRLLGVAIDEGLHTVANLADEWPEAPERLIDCLEYARYQSIMRRAFDEHPELIEFQGFDHESLIGRFQELDQRTLHHNRVRALLAHWEGLPKHDAAGQLGLLKREFEKRRRHLPIRQLIQRAGNAIQAIKPVFMMSPMSIATYLAPGSVKFDLVLFDEASQVKPVEAFGALARGEQVVVVGDDKQLPPTSFFDSVTNDDIDDDLDDNVTQDIESILGLMRSQNCPSRMLRWHYRSRHESLIAVSNQEFYENGLILFPSPDASWEELGLRYHHNPDSVYDRGRSRKNRIEAAEVAEAVMLHARDCPELTLGVAAFSSSQAEAIEDELEMLRKQDISREQFFTAHPEEPFFIKNLENVQGDERDVIFISVGYGRDANGQVMMNFGPVNKEGGERRLNVIISRARSRCHVFTNLSPDDIDLGRSQSRGVRAFKTFLAYAKSGALPSDMPVESGPDVESPFQREVASMLRQRGYDVRDEVASGGKFVDMAIVDPERPGRYLLGIECDGARYHSSRSARERDKIRENHLWNLGWTLHRIWSTDWFRNPDRELNRAVEAIEAARERQPSKNRNDPAPPPEVQRTTHEEALRGMEVQTYTVAQPQLNTGFYDLHEVPHSLLREPIFDIVRVEGPVHVSEVVRRIREATGLARSGRRIQEHIERAIYNAVRSGTIVRKADFLWPVGMATPIVRDRSDVAWLRKIELIPTEEIEEAVKAVVEHSYGIDRADAAIEAARLLGFKSVSASVRTKVDTAIQGLVDLGSLENDKGHLILR